jgi:hypothetical protein
MFSFLWIPELSPASATSFSQQQLTIIEPQYSNQPTNNSTITNCPAYNISARSAQKRPFQYCCAIVAMEICLFVKPLPSNGCCIAASFAVAASQRVYMPKIVTWWSDYRRVLDWRSDLLDSLIQRVTTFYSSVRHRLNVVQLTVYDKW